MVKRRATEEFSIAFLDVICCGFGAVILLLMITKTVQPQVIEQVATDSVASIRALQDQIFKIRGETDLLNRALNSKLEQISELSEKLAILRGQLESKKSDQQSLRLAAQDSTEMERNLKLISKKSGP